MKSKRLAYALVTVALILIEVFIAIYVHDNFVRPYLGDVLVVIAIYTLIRTFIPNKIKLLPVYVFIFAVIVEVLQYFNIVDILGVSNNRFLSVLIGGVFDLKDIMCYAVGCMLLGIFELLRNKYSN